MSTASLAPMLEARSIAAIGASPRAGSVGNEMIKQLLVGASDRAIYPVNPNYEEIEGLRCLPTIEEVPEPVDLVMFGVSNEKLEDQFLRAAKAGARAAVIFSSLFEEPRSDVPPLDERIRATAQQDGIVVCGGNCMGFVNLELGLRALAFAEIEELAPGPITFLSHSGSVFTAMLHNLRGLRFNLAVSTGQELTTTMADYMDYALDRAGTRVMALFLESVRDPARFSQVLGRARDRDVPVVALKVGVEEEARELVAAHSGALAGSDGAYEALFDAYGVMRVATLSEMADVLELLSTGRRAGSGGLAAIHDSGGERAHLIDVAATVGADLARFSDDTAERLKSLLDPGLPAVNPLDAWGTGRDYEGVFRDCMSAMIDDPDTGALALAVDLAGEELEAGYSRAAREVFDRSTLPFAVISHMPSAISPGIGRELRGAGVPILEGTASGLMAFAHLFAFRDHGALPPLESAPAIGPNVRDRWVDRLAATGALDEVDGLALLGDFGIPTTPTRRADDVEEAIAAAEEVGYPVAVKTRAATHKADAGGVHLNLGDDASVRRAYADLAWRLGPRVVVAAMGERGLELALGIHRDAQFGPLVLVAAGGTLVETIRDRALALPPLDRVRAARLIDRLSVRKSLRKDAVDLDAVLDAIVRVSVLALELGDFVDAIDVNPLLCGPRGCVAVDALVVPRSNR